MRNNPLGPFGSIEEAIAYRRAYGDAYRAVEWIDPFGRPGRRDAIRRDLEAQAGEPWREARLRGIADACEGRDPAW